MNTKFVNNIDEFNGWVMNIELDGGNIVPLSNTSEPTEYPALIIWEWPYNTETNTQYVNYGFVYKSDFPEPNEEHKKPKRHVNYLEHPDSLDELRYYLICQYGDDVDWVYENSLLNGGYGIVAVWYYDEDERAIHMSFHEDDPF